MVRISEELQLIREYQHNDRLLTNYGEAIHSPGIDLFIKELNNEQIKLKSKLLSLKDNPATFDTASAVLGGIANIFDEINNTQTISASNDIYDKVIYYLENNSKFEGPGSTGVPGIKSKPQSTEQLKAILSGASQKVRNAKNYFELQDVVTEMTLKIKSLKN